MVTERHDGGLVHDGAAVGEDGQARCPWSLAEAGYVAYHDDEWGVPLHGTIPLYERLCLEGFQSGLSWLLILRKRENFRRAFARFDPKQVASFGPKEVSSLLEDPSIVRNRRKIEAVVRNARAVCELGEDLDELLWSFAPDSATHPRWRSWRQTPAHSPESAAMARTLKKRGFVFVGPVTCYALMQATGMVNDHVSGCWRAS